MSPTQWAAPSAMSRSTAVAQPLGGALGARAVGGGQQREQLVGLPADDHVGVAQAGGEQRRDRLGGAERHADPYEREVAPVAHALGDQTVEQQAPDVRPGKHEAPVHAATLIITSTARAYCST